MKEKYAMKVLLERLDENLEQQTSFYYKLPLS